TEGELGILNVLWTRGPLSVRAIQRMLNETKPTGYTTVLKLLQIMTHKKLVDRDETVRPQIYRARHPQAPTHQRLLGHLPPRPSDATGAPSPRPGRCRSGRSASCSSPSAWSGDAPRSPPSAAAARPLVKKRYRPSPLSLPVSVSSAPSAFSSRPFRIARASS